MPFGAIYQPKAFVHVFALNVGGTVSRTQCPQIWLCPELVFVFLADSEDVAAGCAHMQSSGPPPTSLVGGGGANFQIQSVKGRRLAKTELLNGSSAIPCASHVGGWHRLVDPEAKSSTRLVPASACPSSFVRKKK